MSRRVKEAAASVPFRLALNEFPGTDGRNLGSALRMHLDAPPASGTAVVWFLNEIRQPHNAAAPACGQGDFCATWVNATLNGVVVAKIKWRMLAFTRGLLSGHEKVSKQVGASEATKAWT